MYAHTADGIQCRKVKHRGNRGDHLITFMQNLIYKSEPVRRAELSGPLVDTVQERPLP